jgi:outer membrane murein-binding lipoprotein Lpp
MKSVHLFLIMVFLGAQPVLSHAQVYKWKDKDGNTRYTDTPPPSNVKQETIGVKKAAQPPSAPPPVEAMKPAPSVVEGSAPTVKAEDAAAQIRQRNAEAEKLNKQEKEAEAKRKVENCKAARANYETYNQGGRVYKMSENGERYYLGDKDLVDGKAQAQREISENCN